MNIQMKKTIIAAVLTLAVLPAQAQAETWQVKCKSFSELAQSIMHARQRGVSMATVIQLSSSEPSVSELAHLMTLDAYDHPRFSTDSYQQRAQQDFRDAWYLKCAKVLRSKS